MFLTSYLLLFGASFLAATILPFSSEVILFSMLQQGFSPYWLVVIAAIGNTLGSCVNWWLGRSLLKFQHQRWFYFSPQQVETAQQRFQRYGLWSLLFAWVPIGGDALTLIAGIMRVRFSIFLLLVGIGKTARYVLIVLLAGQFAA